MTTMTENRVDTPALRALIAAEMPGLLDIRHDLHAHPELMFEERRTSEVVVRELTTLGIAHKTGLAKGTGVLAHLPATERTTRPAVGLRADMDALPIIECTGRTYSSTHHGVMHACGHDGHTTILLGAARVLSKLAHRPNPVTFVFQPAEEGGAGGEEMCLDGCLEGDSGRGLGPPVARMYGLHGWPQLPLGQIGTRPGPLLAATDDFKVTVRGTQCHGAYPHLGSDSILASAHIVAALQAIASRHTSPTDSIVVTVGALHGGTATNIIPAETTFIGTVRTLRDETRALARQRFFEIVQNTARAHACEAHIEWEEGYPVTQNDPKLAGQVLAVAESAFGAPRTLLVATPSMGGEDFSYYGRHVPACFYFLGLCPPGREPLNVPQLHQPDFDFNDEALAPGIEMMCRLALSETPR
ncbi:MAG: amidohydrolase [Phycisphaerales bacterium]|nr:amidohydrolase [Phycisphaerales bacterium]